MGPVARFVALALALHMGMVAGMLRRIENKSGSFLEHTTSDALGLGGPAFGL